MEDKSPKGCIDEPIVDMIKTINAHPDYVSLLLVHCHGCIEWALADGLSCDTR